MLAVASYPAEDQRRGAARAEEPANACRARLGHDPVVLAELNLLLAAARTYPQLQENHNFYINTTNHAFMRLPFREAGRRMAAAGVLDRPDDLPSLFLNEIRAFLAGDKTPRGALVAARQAEMARW